MSPSKNPQTQCPRAIRECSKSVQSKSGSWPRYRLPCCLRRPRSAAFTSILLYPTGGALKCAEPSVGATGWPRPWSCWWRCAAAQKTSSRRRTPKGAWSNGKQTRKSWLQPGQGTTRPGQDGGWQRYVVGMPGRRFSLRRSRGRAIAAWRGLCVVFAFAVHIYLGFVVSLKGDFECCESC